MPVKYKMQKTAFKGDGNYHARYVSGNKLDLEELVAEMDLSGTSLTGP